MFNPLRLVAGAAVHKTAGGVCFSHSPLPTNAARDAPLLVFCHATGFCKEIWYPIIQLLKSTAVAPFEWVSIDMSGHGDSRMYTNRLWDTFAPDDIEQVIAHIGGHRRNIVGIGHSFGGFSLVARELMTPSYFKELVLIEPIILPRNQCAGEVLKITGEEFFLAASARKRKDEWKSWEEAREFISTRKLFSKFHPDSVSAYVYGGMRETDDGRITLKCKRENEADMYNGVDCTPQYRDRLHELQCHVHFVIAEESIDAAKNGSGIAADYQEMASLIPNRTVTIAPRCSHLLVLESPEFTARVIQQCKTLENVFIPKPRM